MPLTPSGAGAPSLAAPTARGQATCLAQVVIPTLATLISLRGTAAAPVRNVTLEGLEFTDTVPGEEGPGIDDRPVATVGHCEVDRVIAELLQTAPLHTPKQHHFHFFARKP